MKPRKTPGFSQTYTVRDTIACLVTFTHTVEADNPVDALAAYVDGANICDTPPEIGDALDGYPQKLQIVENKP